MTSTVRSKRNFLSSRREEVIESQYNEIKKLESKYRKLYDEAPDMYRTIDTNGVILECNQSYVSTLGYTRKDDIISHSIFEHVAEESIDAMRDSFEQWKRTGKVRNREVWFKRKDGTTFPALISANNLYDDNGKLIGSNTAIIDETEMYAARKELEEAKQLQDEFVKVAAHELRTPIQPILSYVELARKKIVDNEQALDEIYVQAKKLARLASDIFDVSRIESGSFVYQMKKANCNEFIESVVSAAEAQYNSKSNHDVKILADLRHTVGIDIMADPTRITQVMMNILDNAVKFTDHGTIKVSTELDKNLVRIEVRDTGTGISEKIMPRMFEKFSSLSSMDATKQGTGLGLYLAQKIVHAHKGAMWARNNHDCIGATIGFSLPVWAENNSSTIVAEP